MGHDLDDEELEATLNLRRGESKMYKMKKQYSDFIKKNRLNRKLSKIVGVTEGYISLVINNRRNISKTVAYAVTKAIDSNLEIADVFEIIPKK